MSLNDIPEYSHSGVATQGRPPSLDIRHPTIGAPNFHRYSLSHVVNRWPRRLFDVLDRLPHPSNFIFLRPPVHMSVIRSPISRISVRSRFPSASYWGNHACPPVHRSSSAYHQPFISQWLDRPLEENRFDQMRIVWTEIPHHPTEYKLPTCRCSTVTNHGRIW